MAVLSNIAASQRKQPRGLNERIAKLYSTARWLFMCPARPLNADNSWPSQARVGISIIFPGNYKQIRASAPAPVP